MSRRSRARACPLHRGHAEVEVDHVGFLAPPRELLERLGVARVAMKRPERHLAGSSSKRLLGERIAIDR